MSFIHDNEFRGGEDVGSKMNGSSDLYDLYFEIKDHERACAAGDTSHAFQRLTRIFARFGNERNTSIRPIIETLREGFVKFEKKPGAFSKEGAGYFMDVQEEAVRRLSDMCLSAFKVSSNFARLFADLKNEDGGNRARKKSETKIKEMESLAGDDSEEDIKAAFQTLGSVLRVSPGTFYVKRFSRKRLQEERVDFWIEVELFRRGSGNIDDDLDQQQFAERIYDLYIAPEGARTLGTVISAETRAALKSTIFESDDSCEKVNRDTFASAQAEVLAALEKGLWQTFRASSAYDNFIKRCLKTRRGKRNRLDAQVLAALLQGDATTIDEVIVE